jgi:electron transport complex protein RnfG
LEVKAKLDSILKPSVVLFLVCLVVTCGLALTYNLTKDKIEERAMLDSENAKKEVLENMDSFVKVDNIQDIVERNTGNEALKLVREAYVGVKDGEESGYVFSVVNRGYGGDINLMVGVDKGGKITGVRIAKHSETPGLGSKAADKKFLSQFDGIIPAERLKVIKGQKNKPEEVNAVSGATVSSRAIVEAVQAALDMAAELEKAAK